MIINKSNANNRAIICRGMPLWKISPNAVLESLTSIINCGKINGKPKMAINEAC